MRRDPVDLTAASALSIAAHLVAGAALIALVRFAGGGVNDPLRQTERDADDPRDEVQLELTTTAAPTDLRADKETPVDPPDVRPAGKNDPRPDDGAHGKGGDDRVRERALNLADRDDSVSLERSVLSRLDRSQLPRLKANASRQSREDWRASREPMELTFFSVGPGEQTFERKKLAAFDPAHGAPASARRDSPGMYLGDLPLPDGDGFIVKRPVGSDKVGGPTSAPGVGVRASRQRLGQESEKARVADTRPDVDRATPSVFANDQGHPGDTVDSEQEVASRMQSITHASTTGGAAGAGQGGTEGPGAPGSGGTHGAGSISAPMGAGGSGAPDPREAARITYLRSMQAKIQPLWADAFPRKAALEGKQGTAIISFTVDAGGNVVGASVARSSGIPEFDENVRRAVFRGAPYGPLPDALMPSFVTNLSFVAKNPVVRPRDPGDGIAER